MSKIDNRPPHPAADAFRKTVAAARTSPAGVVPLVDAAALALDLFAMLLDVGVFDLALPFPTDLDDRLGRLQAALDAAAKDAPAPLDDVAAAKRQSLIDALHTSARRVIDGHAPDGLPRKVALLLDTVSSFMAQGHLADVGGMLPRRFVQVADALDVVALDDQAVQA